MKAKDSSIVMMHGYLCSLKTTISTALSQRLRIPRIETKELGHIKTKKGKGARYQLVAEIAEERINGGGSVILDGTFGKRQFRNHVYEIAQRTRAKDVLIIRCLCDNDEEVRRRICERGINESICVSEWRNRAHDGLCGDRVYSGVPSLITVDTANYRVDAKNLTTDFSCEVAQNVHEIMGELKRSCSRKTKADTLSACHA